MDDGKILIANLSNRLLGEDNANLLGALLVSSIQQAAISRANIPEDERRRLLLLHPRAVRRLVPKHKVPDS